MRTFRWSFAIVSFVSFMLGVGWTHMPKPVALLGSQWRCTFVVAIPHIPEDGDCLRWDREGHTFYPDHAKGSNYKVD